MIIVSSERYVPISPGWLVLQDADGAYYYVRRSLYDQAVILEDRYGTHIDVLQNLIGGNKDFGCIQKFVQYAPRPLGILGYFLALLEADCEDFEDIVGALYLITSNVNVRTLINQPEVIRQNVRFSLSVREEYQDLWDRFFTGECYPYEELRSRMSGAYVTSPQTATSYSYSEPEEEEEEVDRTQEVNDLLAGMLDDFNNDSGTSSTEEEPEDNSGLSVLRSKRRKL